MQRVQSHLQCARRKNIRFLSWRRCVWTFWDHFNGMLLPGSGFLEKNKNETKNLFKWANDAQIKMCLTKIKHNVACFIAVKNCFFLSFIFYVLCFQFIYAPSISTACIFPQNTTFGSACITIIKDCACWKSHSWCGSVSAPLARLQREQQQVSVTTDPMRRWWGLTQFGTQSEGPAAGEGESAGAA